MRQEVTIAGEDAWICSTTGWVKGEKKWSETTVGGGGAHFVGNTVYSRPVTTTNNTRHEFWICSADGSETCIDLGHSNVRVRDGQLVSAAWGASKRSQNGPFILLHNQSGQETKWLIGDGVALIERMKLKNPLGKGTKFLCIAGILIGALMVLAKINFMLGLLFLGGGIAYLVYCQQQQKKKAEEIRVVVQRVLTDEIQQTKHTYMRPNPVPPTELKDTSQPLPLPN